MKLSVVTTMYRSEAFIGEFLRRVTPVYETVPGWQKDITGVRKMADLPQAARDYLDRISQLIGRPVEVVSIGPDREQTIFAERT